jgi:hypothetical protein
LVISEHAVVAGIGDIGVAGTVHRYADGRMNAATTGGRAETVGRQSVELNEAAVEIAALAKNRGRRQTPAQRPCVREHECTTVDGIHRVQIFVGVDRDRVKSEEPVVEALIADRSSATVGGKAAAAGAENLVRVYIARASRAVNVGRTTHRRAERIEVHQEARRIAVRHKQVALRVHRDAARLVKTRRGRRTCIAIVRREAAAAGAENKVRRCRCHRIGILRAVVFEDVVHPRI